MTLKEKLGQPQILAAIKDWKRKGASNVEIVAGLQTLGIKTTPQSLNSTLGAIERDARGDGKAKSKSERRPRQTANAPTNSTGTQAETPTTGGAKADSKPDETGGAKPEGRKLTKSPSMGGAFNQDEL
ncbi:hypothetical protein [Ensifer sp. B1-9]|uniref:hypothetical protein n=1 Tax=Ensifer sp. B1-9 TaxID=3141455 RepID=UPI003D23251F